MKKSVKIILIIAVAGLIIGGGIGLYMYYMPKRDVQATNTDYKVSAAQIVTEYLSDKNAANQKYLSDDGDSKVLEITGTVAKISEDYNGNKVVLLKNPDDKAGVSATFLPETNQHADQLKPGQTITIKGVIRSGAAYNEDLEMYENVIVEKSDIIKK